jgi:molecular chaperone GrpE
MARKKEEMHEDLKNQEMNDEDITDATNSANEEAAEETKETQANEDKEKEDAAQAEIKNLNDRLLRLQADFLNYKARTEKEKTSTYSNAVADVMLDMLPVVDNLERAIAADKTETDSFKEGVVMVYNQLMGILNKKGLKEVEALHKPFDHNVHYGVGYEASDEFEDGIIIDVLQKGYTFNDKCIRPAMVRIAKND